MFGVTLPIRKSNRNRQSVLESSLEAPQEQLLSVGMVG